MDDAQLRDYQAKHGLTNVSMCEGLGVAPVTYSRWRNGRQPIPHWVPTLLAQLTPAATMKTRALKHHERVMAYKNAAGRDLPAADRKALPAGVTYWQLETDGTWSEWTRAEPGYSDIHTGATTTWPI